MLCSGLHLLKDGAHTRLPERPSQAWVLITAHPLARTLHKLVNKPNMLRLQPGRGFGKHLREVWRYFAVVLALTL